MKNDEISKEVLRNAIIRALEEMPFGTVRDFVMKTLSNLERELVESAKKETNVRGCDEVIFVCCLDESDEDFHEHREKSFEQDAKEIDDAQRYRDLKS